MAHAPERTINRYYDPTTDQFLSVDPDVATTEQPYLYAGDDPVNGVDPMGLDPTEILYGQGSLFADAAAAEPGYFNYGTFNDLSTVLVNAINAPFISFDDAYDNIFQAGQDGCPLRTVITLTGDAVTADIDAGLFFAGDPEGEALDTIDATANETRGGVYTLRDPETGDVVRTGRSNSLATRRLTLANDPALSNYEFQVEYRTDNYAEQRGLEQVLYDQYSNAQAINGGFNYIRAISLSNSNISQYLQAAQGYLAGLRGG
jgi:hypothetical protein